MFSTRVIGIAAAVMLMGGNILSQEREFRVDSYIPEYFTDFRWLASGYASFWGDYSDDGANSSSDRQEADFSSDAQYDYVTIPTSFMLGLQTRLNLQNSDYDEDYDSPTSFYDVKSDSRNYMIRFSPRASGQQYWLGDFFVASSSVLLFEYNAVPESKFDRTRIESCRTCGIDYEKFRSSGNQDRRTLQLRGDLTAGWGRVYDGRFSYTALSIIDVLRSEGLLEREPTYSELMVLTDTAYVYQQMHIVDYRVRRIRALSDITGYLVERGILHDMNELGPYLIQDVWDYFPRASRPFGWSIETGVGIEYSHRNEHGSSEAIREILDSTFILDSLAGVLDTTLEYHTSSTRDDETSFPFILATLRYSTPLSLRWQADFSLSGRYYFEAREQTYIQNREYSPYLRPNQRDLARIDYNEWKTLTGAIAIKYFFDSRTECSLLGTVDYIKQERTVKSFDHQDYDNESAWDEHEWLYLQARGVFQYRISIPTELRIQASLRENGTIRSLNPAYTDSERWTTSYRFSIALTHFLY